MERELFIGVDVSKRWLDLAYYDGVNVDWKHGHIRVDNKESGFVQIGKWLKGLGVDKDSVLFCMEYTGLYCQDLRAWLEKEGFVYGMVNPRKMHRFEPDLAAGERALDRIKTDEMDSFRIAMYCEKHCRKIRSQPSRLPAPAYFKLKRLIAERRQYVVQSALYKQQLHDVCDYDTDGSVCRKKEELKSLMAHVR
jgi:transposase